MLHKDTKHAPIKTADARKVVEEQMGCKYVECSALTQQGLKEVFDEAMRVVMARQIKPMKKKEKKEGGCNLI